MKNYKVYLVPHTHWDKEWYFTKDVSDVYLIDNMKNILEAHELDAQEAPFVWDGQYSVVDDYLKFYPQDYAKIANLVKTKKLIVGPWYSQTDTFNALGESIVRNLLVGTKLSEQLGHSMKVAYLPDTFGFNANLPQLVQQTKNLGIINWRGAEDGLINHSLFNMWEADDGTKFPLYNLYQHGYYTGVGGLLKQYRSNWATNHLVEWSPKTKAKEHAQFYIDWVKPELEILKPLAASTGNRILIPVGSDQMPMARGWKAVVQAMNELDQEHEYILSDFESFMADLTTDETVMKNAQTVKGQFRYGKYARAHKTITSSRYDIKKFSRLTENMLYSELEPLAVIYEQLGGEYPHAIILEASKMLLQCHAHDSLGGCNTDETNRTILARLESARGLLEGQITLIKKRIADAIPLQNNQILLFNLLPNAQKREFTMDIYTKTPSFKLKDRDNEIEFGTVSQKYYNNKDFRIEKVTPQFIEPDAVNVAAEGPSNATNLVLGDPEGRFGTTINFNLEMPGLGYKVLDLEPIAETLWQPTINNEKLTNDFYELSFKNNEFQLYDKRTKTLIENAFVFEAVIDHGDTYDFSPPADCLHNLATLQKATVVASQDVHLGILDCDLDFKLAAPSHHQILKNQKIKARFILNGSRIDCHLEMNNQNSDLRWRLLFKTDIHHSELSYADQCFAITSRKIVEPLVNQCQLEKWSDVPIEIEAMESLVYLQDETHRHAIFTSGNNEYQIIGQDAEIIAITLFRGVSYMGRRDLLYRGGRASGINDYAHPTPDSNLLTPLSFDLALYRSNADDNLNRLSKIWNQPTVYYQRQTLNQFLWKGDTFVLSQRPLPKQELTKELINLGTDFGQVVVSALKKSWDNKKVLLRVYNPTNKTLNLDHSAVIGTTDLMENPLSTNSAVLRPNEIRTLVLELAK